jgi:hypothetical protein
VTLVASRCHAWRAGPGGTIMIEGEKKPEPYAELLLPSCTACGSHVHQMVKDGAGHAQRSASSPHRRGTQRSANSLRFLLPRHACGGSGPNTAAKIRAPGNAVSYERPRPRVLTSQRRGTPMCTSFVPQIHALWLSRWPLLPQRTCTTRPWTGFEADLPDGEGVPPSHADGLQHGASRQRRQFHAHAGPDEQHGLLHISGGRHGKSLTVSRSSSRPWREGHRKGSTMLMDEMQAPGKHHVHKSSTRLISLSAWHRPPIAARHVQEFQVSAELRTHLQILCQLAGDLPGAGGQGSNRLEREPLVEVFANTLVVGNTLAAPQSPRIFFWQMYTGDVPCDIHRSAGPPAPVGPTSSLPCDARSANGLTISGLFRSPESR